MEEKIILTEEENENQEIDRGAAYDCDAVVENIYDVDEEDEEEEKVVYRKKTDTPMGAALRSVVFGMVAIIITLFSLLFFTLGAFSISLITCGAAIVFAVFSYISANKVLAFSGEFENDIAKVGRLLAVVAMIAATLVLIYVIIQMFITIVTVVAMVIFYVIMFTITMLFGGAAA